MKTRFLSFFLAFACAVSAPGAEKLFQNPKLSGSLNLSDLRSAVGELPLSAVPQLNAEQHAAQAIDRRIAGKTFATNAPLFTSSAFTTRNALAWCADIDLTAVCVGNTTQVTTYPDSTVQARLDSEYAKRIPITAVAPDICIGPHHAYPQNGNWLRWRDASGTAVDRSVASSVQIGTTDIRVIKLSSPLPATIRPAKVLPADYAAKLVLLGAPVLRLDQDRNALVADVAEVNPTDTTWAQLRIEAAGDATRALFHENGIEGDSGSPSGLIIDGQFAMIGCAYSSNRTSIISNSFAAINTAIAGLGSSSTLTPLALPERQSILRAQVRDLPALSTAATANAIPQLNGSGKLALGMLPTTGTTVEWADVQTKPFTLAEAADGSLNTGGNAVLYGGDGSVFLRANGSGVATPLTLKAAGTYTAFRLVSDFEVGMQVGSYNGALARFGKPSGSYSADNVFPTIPGDFVISGGSTNPGALYWSGTTAAASKAVTRTNLEAPRIVTKTDTGDPTATEPTIVINTFDNTVKIYAEGAWRTLATW